MDQLKPETPAWRIWRFLIRRLIDFRRGERLIEVNVPVIGRGLVFCWAVVLAGATGAQVLNGFNLEGSLVPPDQILSGGPPKDGIPAVDVPKFVPANAGKLDAADRAYVLENGRVAMSGAAAALRDDPGVRKAYLGV